MAIETKFEFVSLSDEELKSLKHERVSNAVSATIAKAIMSAGISKGAVMVHLADVDKGRSLAGTVNSVLKRFKSNIRTKFRLDEKTNKQYLTFDTEKTKEPEAPAPVEPEASTKRNKR